MAKDAKSFLRKRAPFYLAGLTLVLILVVPGILEKDIDDVIADSLNSEEIQKFDYVMDYTGPNDSGISIKEAVSEKIQSTYTDGNVYDHRSTSIIVSVLATSIETYRVIMDFTSYDQDFRFVWDVEGDRIRGSNDISKDVVDLVDFYD